MDKKLPQILYKYRRIGKGAEQILTEHMIRFDTPSAFNDLFECRPLYWWNPKHPNHKRFVQEGIGITFRNPGERIKAMREFERRFSTPQPMDGLDGFDWLHKELGILCLSEARDNLLLWGLYADSHKGICIGFDTSISFFGTAREVHYQEEYPIIERVGDNPVTVLNKTVFTKGKCWENEKEWRIAMLMPTPERIEEVKRHPDPSYRTQMLMHKGPGDYPFPRDAITEVIIGAKTSPADIGAIIEWIKKGGINPKLLRAKRNPLKFALDFEDMSGLIK